MIYRKRIIINIFRFLFNSKTLEIIKKCTSLYQVQLSQTKTKEKKRRLPDNHNNKKRTVKFPEPLSPNTLWNDKKKLLGKNTLLFFII